MILRRTQCALATVLVAVTRLILAGELQADTSKGDTRVSDSNQSYWVEQVAEGFNFPSSMVWLPSGDLLIVERIGSLRIIRRGELDPQPIEGVPASYRSYYDGLKDIVLDPDYRANQAIYLLISEGTFESRHAAVYRARFSGSRLENVVRIFRSKGEMGGAGLIASRMMFLADKTLLVGLPEDRIQGAQELSSHKGKIVRINRDGSVPKDNPFVNRAGALPEIYSYGHRVPLGLYQEVNTGTIWEVESGPRGGDELNILKAGANYGWAKASWGFAYGNNGLDAPLQSAPGIENPILVWTPSITPSGLTRYSGSVYPLWDGDYFIGNLSGKGVERLRMEGKRVVVQERMLLDLEERIRDVKVGPDSHIYLLTDHQNGRVLRLQPGHPRGKQLAHVAHKLVQVADGSGLSDLPSASEDAIANMEPDELASGKQAFLERCAACHSMGGNLPGGEIGPDLAGVYGRSIGRKPGFDYSINMLGSVYLWDFAMLDRFLTNPAGLFPGTKMQAPPVTDMQIRRSIIGFLKQQSAISSQVASH